ncbi:MAG: chromosomal replication initiator protein DnaA [Lachnospiraceae bacterium]|nr:chromosomal replication initiator protein DnaA [Lachnospiraceae bacterium]
MLEQLKSKWDEILCTIIKEHDIAKVSFETWLEPLEIYDIEDNKLILMVSDEKISTSYISKKFYYPLKVTIHEITGFPLDIEFLHKSEIEDKKKSSTEIFKPSNPILTDAKREASINPDYTFDNFVVGGNNNYAHAYALAVAESPAEMYNPLFIHGGVGLGKTHLLHSIGNFVLDRNPNAKVRCVNSETFTNEVINAIRTEKQSAINELRDKYRNIDLFIIDDIQFIIGKERSQEEFFHTFNTLYEAKKQIVISSDKPPKSLSPLEERFKSRFEMGLIVDISSPDYETRMAILKKKAEKEHYHIDDIILQYIADNIKSNIRELEGALTKIIAFSRVSKQQISIDLAKDVLKDIISPEQNRIVTPELIISIVADHYGISQADIASKKKSADIVYPRQIAMYLCRNLTDSPYSLIGSLLGKRDHSTVMHAIDKIQDELDINESLRNNIEIIKKKIIPN